MKRYLKLFYLFLRYNLIRTMMYKEDFMAWTMVSFGWLVFNIIFYQLIFNNVESIAGWTRNQVLLLQGFTFIFNGILWGVFWANMREIPRKINAGTLDLAAECIV